MRFELTRCCLRNSRSAGWSYIAVQNRGRGVRPTRLFELHDLRPVTVLPETSHAPINWYPRKDSNLQPLVCRTSAPSIELLGQELVVGVGIEPTSRVLQTRANPSQLSDLMRFGARGETRTLVTGFAIRRLSRLATRAKTGTEGEIRTLVSSLEDSHVSSYITSA